MILPQNCVENNLHKQKHTTTFVLFASLISRTFSTNEQYFYLTTNQSMILSVIAYQPNEQGIYLYKSPYDL